MYCLFEDYFYAYSRKLVFWDGPGDLFPLYCGNNLLTNGFQYADSPKQEAQSSADLYKLCIAAIFVLGLLAMIVKKKLRFRLTAKGDKITTGFVELDDTITV